MLLPQEEEHFPTLLPHVPVGGRITHFLGEWQVITSDKWVLFILQRSPELEFKELPPLSVDPIEMYLTKDSIKNTVLQEEARLFFSRVQ